MMKIEKQLQVKHPA